MANFQITYSTTIKPNEGGYANVSGDKGGETYAGIARNFHPNWTGWSIIDFEKSRRKIKHNEIIPELNLAVEDFYLDLWNDNRMLEIQNQKLANFIFDFIVNSGSAIKIIQRVVGVKQDGKIGPITINAINTTPGLLSKLIDARRELYNKLAKLPGQDKFLDGWLARLATFSSTSGISIVVILFLFLILFL